jgi:hypothetical protein
MARSEIVAYYSGTSKFEVDFDIEKVHQWWIKWDTLYVIHNEGEKAKEYDTYLSADNDILKHPYETDVEVSDEETA